MGALHSIEMPFFEANGPHSNGGTDAALAVLVNLECAADTLPMCASTNQNIGQVDLS